MKRKAFWLGGALVVALVAGCESTGAARTSERVELRALSEISPTFSANETAERGALEVAPEASVVDVAVSDADESDAEDDEDAIESLDYDEWATVFLADAEARDDAADGTDSENDESFLNYFDEVNEEEEEWEDEEEYEEEEEFDDDADEEEEEFDENDDFDETDEE